MHACTYACTIVCMHPCRYLCTCMHVHMCTCLHTYVENPLRLLILYIGTLNFFWTPSSNGLVHLHESIMNIRFTHPEPPGFFLRLWIPLGCHAHSSRCIWWDPESIETNPVMSGLAQSPLLSTWTAGNIPQQSYVMIPTVISFGWRNARLFVSLSQTLCTQTLSISSILKQCTLNFRVPILPATWTNGQTWSSLSHLSSFKLM